MPLNGPSIRALLLRSARCREHFPPRPAGYAGQWPKTIEDIEAGRTPWLWLDPFISENLGVNSYDVTLDRKLLVYRRPGDGVLDAHKENPTDEVYIPVAGLVLDPGKLYLGSTRERVYTRDLVPDVDGRSSVGRLGLSVHVTAGRGDLGFRGTYTLEITVVHPVRIYPGDRIAQLYFDPPTVYPTVDDQPVDYKGRYQEQSGATPSRFHQATPQ